MVEPESADKTTLPAFLKDLHRDHVIRTSTETDTIEYAWTSYLRINGVYWGLSAMSLLGHDVKKDMAVPGSEIADWIMSCQVILSSLSIFYVKGLGKQVEEN